MTRYAKYRARVSALALDPAIQGIVYCGIFLLLPLGHALIPLFMREVVYMLWVLKEVLQIAAPGGDPHACRLYVFSKQEGRGGEGRGCASVAVERLLGSCGRG